jgi:hypothetical protein
MDAPTIDGGIDPLSAAAGFTVPTPGELDGSEPVDDPPTGFATWDAWRRHRWPPSVS